MKPRSILTSSTAALAAVLMVGCGPIGSDAGASSPDSSSSSPVPVVESKPHSTGLEHVTESSEDPGLVDGAARPENAGPEDAGQDPAPAPDPTAEPTPGQTVFTYSDGPDGQPGPTTTSAPLPGPEDLNSDLMVAPGEQGEVGQPRHPNYAHERLWNGQVPVWAECTDEAALAANADHEPAGWPADHQPGEPLPSPLCHPDFIETMGWEHYDEFSACCEGLQNGTIMLPPSANEQRVYAALWDQSQARADWSPGDTELPDH